MSSTEELSPREIPCISREKIGGPMKRFLMLVAVAAVAGAMYVAAASGSQQSRRGPTAKQFAALKKEVGGLKKQLTQVKAIAVDADSFIAQCLIQGGAAPVSQFGDAQGQTYGYHYNDGTNEGYRTALDLDTSANPQGYLQGVDPSCLAPAATHRSVNRLSLRTERTR
jgi:hypothetical protein